MADAKISALTELATTPATDDYLPIIDASEVSDAGKNKRITVGNLFGYNKQADIYRQDGRLTLVSGNPDVLADQADKTTLYFTPYCGDTIALYTSGAWALHNFSELSMAVDGSSASTLYDIFAYNASGTVSLERVAWSNSSTRATGLIRQNGVYVKNGDATRRWLGTVRVQSDTKYDDKADVRGVYNHNNRIPKHLADYTEAAKTMYFIAGEPNGLWTKCGVAGTIGGFTMQYITTSGAQSATQFEAGQQRSTSDVVGSGITIVDFFATGYHNVVRTSNDYTHLERCAFWIEYYG